MKLQLTCGICDFDTLLEDATAAQIELQWDLFTSRHQHTPEELIHYIDARAGWSPVDDEDGPTDGTPEEKTGG